MYKKQLAIFIIGCLFIILTACAEQNESAENAPLENLFPSSELSYNEYKFIFEDVLERAEKMNVEDPELKKWVIRALGDEKLMNKRDLSTEETTVKAESDQRHHKEWINIAENKYEVKVTEEELDSWITAGPDQYDVPQQKAYADALDITVEELNHHYDRDLYKQALVWEKLVPILEKEYNVSNRDELLERFEKEVEES